MLHIPFLEPENEVIVGVYLICLILVYKGGKNINLYLLLVVRSFLKKFPS